MRTVRLCVLVSGSGTILESMLASGVPVDLVGSDRPCRALDVAAAAGLETILVDRANFGGFATTFDREAYTVALREALLEREIGLVAMAGFGTVTSASFYDSFAGRVLNTHPSLLPSFKGWHAVRDALAAGATESGCTVHVATPELDDGPILARSRVEVHPDDDESTLHERIKSVERELYPRVILAALAALRRGEDVASLRLP